MITRCFVDTKQRLFFKEIAPIEGLHRLGNSNFCYP